MTNQRQSKELQQRLPALFDGAIAADNTTAIIVPSLTLDSKELKKVPGAVHFEERLLFLLKLLSRPRTHVVYVTSEPLDREVVDYALDLGSSLPCGHARQRLTLLDCQDGAPQPLVQKILQQPALMKKALRAVPDLARAYLVTYTSSPLEQELALKLDVPLYACDPEMLGVGTKSGSRRLFKQVGVPVSEGAEDIWSAEGLAAALADLKTANPNLNKAIIKLNESFAGGGNAVFSFKGAPARKVKAWIAAELPRRLAFGSATETWASYLEKLTKMGGIAEVFVDAPGTHFPSVQLEITPDGEARVLSTHEQVLGGAMGQSFTGCSFPARSPYRLKIQDLGLRAGKTLAKQGVRGHLSIDFVARDAADYQPIALEVNLRMGGATAPFFIFHGLIGGSYSQATGEYLTPEGSPRFYVSTDRAADDAFRQLSPNDAVDIALRSGLHYSQATRTGVAFFVLGGLSAGRIGLVAIESTPEKAQSLYERVLAALKP